MTPRNQPRYGSVTEDRCPFLMGIYAGCNIPIDGDVLLRGLHGDPSVLFRSKTQTEFSRIAALTQWYWHLIASRLHILHDFGNRVHYERTTCHGLMAH
ncbi:hypothetical protein [Scrofimicrobium canadense]|nr:hypothetical protein [Scrofimicrobium canadense]